MKKQEKSILVVVAIISGIISFIVSGLLISNDANTSQNSEVVEVITSELQRPDPKYFNANAINPTQDVSPSQEPNSNPFGSQ
jgi:hypothetical protein